MKGSDLVSGANSIEIGCVLQPAVNLMLINAIIIPEENFTSEI